MLHCTVMRHLQYIANSPRHVTLESNKALCARLNRPLPLAALKNPVEEEMSSVDGSPPHSASAGLDPRGLTTPWMCNRGFQSPGEAFYRCANSQYHIEKGACQYFKQDKAPERVPHVGRSNVRSMFLQGGIECSVWEACGACLSSEPAHSPQPQCHTCQHVSRLESFAATLQRALPACKLARLPASKIASNVTSLLCSPDGPVGPSRTQRTAAKKQQDLTAQAPHEQQAYCLA